MLLSMFYYLKLTHIPCRLIYFFHALRKVRIYLHRQTPLMVPFYSYLQLQSLTCNASLHEITDIKDQWPKESFLYILKALGFFRLMVIVAPDCSSTSKRSRSYSAAGSHLIKALIQSNYWVHLCTSFSSSHMKWSLKTLLLLGIKTKVMPKIVKYIIFCACAACKWFGMITWIDQITHD